MSIMMTKNNKLFTQLLLGLGLMVSTSITSFANTDWDILGDGFVKISNYSLETMDEASSIEIMTYKMPNVLEQSVDATALVLFPHGEKPKDGWKVVVWMHGTVGVSNSCAPSLNPLNENFKVAAKSLLNAGYVIIEPDYEGLGAPGIHPYLNISSEAKAAIYSVKTLQQKYIDDFHGDWMVAGQSQGGQAALGTAEYANEDPTFKGAVAGAPASNFDRIIEDIAPAALTNLERKEIANNIAMKDRYSISSYATLLAYGTLIGMGLRAEYPDYDYLALFQDRAKPIAREVEDTTGENGLCLKPLRDLFQQDIIQYLTEKPEASLMSYPGLNMDYFERDKILQQFFVDNQPGTKRLDKPVLIIQGELDTNVPAVVTQDVVDHLKALGSQDIRLILVPNAHHRDAIVWRNDDLMAFIEEHMPAR